MNPTRSLTQPQTHDSDRRLVPMRYRMLIAAVAAVGVFACGDAEQEQGDATPPADTLTTEQRDSAMAELPIPGIGGIGAARRAVDAAEERAAQHDSIR